MKVRQYPAGAQHTVSRRTWPFVALLVAAFIFLTLAVQAFVAANPALFGHPRHFVWSLSIVRFNEALTLLFAALSLLAIQQQLSLNNRPYLIVISGVHADSQLGLSQTPIWRVTAKNVGSGVAVIQNARFNACTADDRQSLVDYSTLAAWLTSKSVGTDVACISRFSKGTAIGSDAELAVFEGQTAGLSALQTLEIQLEYESSLGERFVRTISMLPPR